MKENLTCIAAIIDSSGSMSGLRNDTIGSFNLFLKEQKEFPGEAIFTLCIFNDDYRLVHDFEHIHNVADLSAETYRPSGNTALLDAMGATIDSLGKKLAALSEEERPGKVLVLVQTDGQENSSHRYTASQIKEMVEHQQQVYSWNFVFIGANIDAFTTGTSLGFTGSNSVAYAASSVGTKSLYSSISSNTSALRSRRSSDSVTDFFGQTGQTPTGTVPQTVVTPSTPVTPTTPTTGSDTSTK